MLYTTNRFMLIYFAHVSSPIPIKPCHGGTLVSLFMNFYHGCFEWTNQIAQTEVDKSLINLQVIYQPTSSNTRLYGPWQKLVMHLGYGSNLPTNSVQYKQQLVLVSCPDPPCMYLHQPERRSRSRAQRVARLIPPCMCSTCTCTCIGNYSEQLPRCWCIFVN